MDSQINVLLTSFGGLNLPRTLSFPVSSTSSVHDLSETLTNRIPQLASTRLIVTTNSNKQILPSSSAPISSLLSSPNDAFLPLRLSAPLCGGKGGFGSILRAQGGRMSSRKKRQQGEENGSSRNLEGRRIRTVNEARALAEFLKQKPELERQEAEERRKRLEAVVETTERKEDEIRNGKNTRLDGKWVEDKEEAEQKTRDAILAAYKAGQIKNAMAENESNSSGAGSEGSEGSDSEGVIEATAPSSSTPKPKATPVTFHGWDEDEEYMSSSDEEGDQMDVDADPNGKGKAKA